LDLGRTAGRGSAAAAHPGHGPISGFAAGVQHPLSGIDHLLAMIAVGLWAGLCGGRREWLWPATFVSSMVAGGVIAMFAVITIPVEPAILASVLVLGLATALSLRAPAGSWRDADCRLLAKRMATPMAQKCRILLMVNPRQSPIHEQYAAFCAMGVAMR